jgi:hypothetical protein
MDKMVELLQAEAIRQQPTTMPAFAELVQRRRRRDLRAGISLAALLLIVGVGAGVFYDHGGTEATPTPAASSTGFSTARLALSATNLRSGQSLSAKITVNNDTGRPLRFAGCGPIYRALLVEQGKSQVPSWPLCMQTVSIPEGESTYDVPVDARYSECSTNGSQGIPECRSDRSMPFLPAGTYEVVVFGVDSIVPLPAPTSITVVP